MRKHTLRLVPKRISLLLGIVILVMPTIQCYLDPGQLTSQLGKLKDTQLQPKLPCQELQALSTYPPYNGALANLFSTEKPYIWGCMMLVDPLSYTWQKEDRQKLVRPVWLDRDTAIHQWEGKLTKALHMPAPIDYKAERTYARLYIGTSQGKTPSEAAHKELQALCKRMAFQDFRCHEGQNASICLLFIDFQPQSQDGSQTFAKPAEGKTCKTCSPEVCDSKDNDCDGENNESIAAAYQCTKGLTCIDNTCQCRNDKTQCTESCADLQSDTNHCGACDNKCYPGMTCTAGKCVCANEGEIFCEQERRCIDVKTNLSHCGSCGNVCFGGNKCVDGVCVCKSEDELACFAGRLCIGNNTVVACGACDAACGANETCKDGTCTCGGGKFINCKGVCTNKWEEDNCGACGNKCTKGSCFQGKCCEVKDGTCDCGTKGDPSKDPALSFGVCGDACINLATNSKHCGTCGNECKENEECHQDPSSKKISCRTRILGLCQGKQTNFSLDPTNCGACGNKCPSHLRCFGGTCQCPKVYDFSAKENIDMTLCGDTCQNTMSSALHCGKCNNKCPDGSLCVKGVCEQAQ